MNKIPLKEPPTNYELLKNVTKKRLPVFIGQSEKGRGLYANRHILAGEKICHYRVTVFSSRWAPGVMKYGIEVYGKSSRPLKRKYGNIMRDSFPDPVDSVPFWGALINDSSRPNAFILAPRLDPPVRVGDVITYTVIAQQPIAPKIEITVNYGPNYARTYLNDETPHLITDTLKA